jgi:serine/threonine protein kinase
VSLRSGATVLHYRIERRLGAGGMGEVYLAQDTTLNRAVAIKFLTTPDDDRARRRLLREARAAAGLDHPGVCAVYQVGTDPTFGDFVVMQYVEGEPLSDRLRRGRLDPTEALRVGAQVAEALMAAHERGIVHRDLKPQNIILSPSGRPKLLDFGLAKRTFQGLAAAEAPTTAALTRPNAVLGTPGYMAPEQIRNGTVDRRADVFALGCVLYECLTGRRAFPGPTAADMLSQVLQTNPPAPSSVIPGIGLGVDALCARLLQKDVNERFQSAEEALGAIHTLLPPGTPASDATKRASSTSVVRWRPSGPVVFVVVGLVIAVAVGTFLELRHRNRLPPPSRDAQTWFDRGVTAIREGAYAGAKSSFEEAIRIDPGFPQAYARLAEARRELDDEGGAQQALLHVSQLVPDASDLETADRLQLDAVTASVLGEHDRAIADYASLAKSRPSDAAAALDLGRAEEAAYRLGDARASYTRAVELDSQYAAAYARLGFLQGTPTKTALGQLEEAVRLYGAAADAEGEAEALLRKGVLLSAAGRYDEGRQALNQVIALATEPRYASLRVRAELETARLTAYGGHFQDSEALGSKAVDEATAAGWQVVAANGLVDLGTTFMLANQTDAADALFGRAITLAAAQGATRTAMRAQLSQASLRSFTHHPQEAIALAQGPLKFFTEGHYPRLEATAQAVLSRADGDLEQYGPAMALANQALSFAETAGNDEVLATALENLAGISSALGRLPEALADRERIEQIHRSQKDLARLGYDLQNRAELLIRLGRLTDAQAPLDELAQGIRAGLEAYKGRGARLSLDTAFMASVRRQFANVVATLSSNPLPPGASDETTLFARVLLEHARAELGSHTADPATVTHWLTEANSPQIRRELAYWVADTLIALGDRMGAEAVAGAALAEPGGQENLELRWRLEAVSARAGSTTGGGASMPSGARSLLQRLQDQWGAAMTDYLARPDLRELRRALQ